MKRILICRGGGMKGLPQAAAMDELRRMAGGSLTSKVDFFAGTSIGGIDALFGSLDQSGLPFFNQDGPKIFAKSFWRFWPMYPAAPLENALKRGFGELTLADCRARVLVTSFDKVAQAPFMFKSYDTSNLLRGAATKLRDIGRATSAAQKYFPAMQYGLKKLQDGGNVINDPAVCALADAVKIWGKDEPFKILVLGCGDTKVQLARWMPVWLQELSLTIAAPFETGAEEVDYQMDAFAGDSYRLCQPLFPAPVALDSADVQSLAWLNETATNFVKEHRRDFKWFLE